MKSALVFSCCFLAAIIPLSAQQAKKSKDVAGLPRVLLIGDSISMGYTGPVQKRLAGKAKVHRIPANGGPTSRGIANIDKWLGDGNWDVIHFNWGIHDLKHMPDGKRQVEPADYEKNLRALVAKLKATGARLIWASTTPIPDPPLKPERTFGDETEYNAIAAKVMKENEIPINDLHGHIKPRFAEFHKPRDLHFLPQGSEFLADKVAEEIKEAIGESVRFRAIHLKTAISNFFVQYRRFPIRDDQNDPERVVLSGHELMDVLLASDKETGPKGINPRGTSFGSFQKARSASDGKFRKGVTLDADGGGELWDLWGNHYRVIMDSNFDNRIAAPSWVKDVNVILQGVIVWSPGPDGNDNTAEDNIITW